MTKPLDPEVRTRALALAARRDAKAAAARALVAVQDAGRARETAEKAAREVAALRRELLTLRWPYHPEEQDDD